MNKVKKILTTLVAATLTVSTGLTSMPMFAHNVKAESKGRIQCLCDFPDTWSCF